MKYLFLTLFLLSSLSANPFDDFHLFMGKRLLDANKTDEAMKHYEKIDNKSDELSYNMGNILYEQKKYKEAIKQYKSIKKPSLQFSKFYNLGNSYAKNKMLDESIKAYEEALKIKNDNDAKINLMVVKKAKAKQEDEQNDKKQKINKLQKGDNQLAGVGQEDLDNAENRDNKRLSEEKKAKNNEKQKEQNNERTKANNEQIKQSELPSTKEELEKQKIKNLKPLQQASEMSDEEEKKWLNIISKKEFNTLMIPLNKNGAKNDKTINPW